MRYGPLALIVAGAVLLIVAEFLTLREIKAVTAVPEGGRTSGGAHHGYALAVIGVVMLPMGYGAVVGASRPAAVAVLVLALAAAGVVLVADLPTLDETGVIGRTYDLAEAHPAIGFWLESAGAVLALAGAVLALVRTRASDPPGRRSDPRPPPPDEVNHRA